MSDYKSAVQAWQSGRDASGERGAMPESFRIPRAFKRSPERVAALARVKEWTRERFKLPHDAAILVAEVACAVPGCPPLETAVAFWTGTDTRHQFKVFKPVEEVVADDLPPSWMKDALIEIEGAGFDCC